MSPPAIPGTHEPGYVEQRIVQHTSPAWHELERRLKESGAKGCKHFRMGECSIIIAREPAGADGERLWHLSISHPDRHPTWDEIKTARYRLMPHSLCFGMLLPPPEFYVNVPQQDHVFHLWEITDPREPWSGM